MGFLDDNNVNLTMTLSRICLKFGGFWCPDNFVGYKKILYHCYTFVMFMFILGSYMLSQLIDLYLNFGDISVMTAIAFILLTDLVQTLKMGNLLLKKDRIQKLILEANEALKMEMWREGRDIIKRCDQETRIMLWIFLSLTIFTLCGWAGSVDQSLKQLPIRAWYPYDTTKYPAYELTYSHQAGVVFISAALNIAKDCTATTLIAQTRCRLQLLNQALRNLHKDIIDNTTLSLMTSSQEAEVEARLRKCVQSHQEALKAAAEIQECFSLPTFAQFLVSMIIICVTAFQLAFQTKNIVAFISMGTYLLNMIFQVFLYCYQGNKLRDESTEVASSAYACSWYTSSMRFRKMLLLLMMRARKPLTLEAGGFFTLTLHSFMTIIKTSYSFFTVLQRVGSES